MNEVRLLHSHKVDGAGPQLEIEVVDAPGAGAANHRYDITGFDTESNPSALRPDGYGSRFSRAIILFQHGPIQGGVPNGITIEVLLAIAEHRLQGFQSGSFACSENAAALQFVSEALQALRSRTKARVKAGVEGKMIAFPDPDRIGISNVDPGDLLNVAAPSAAGPVEVFRLLPAFNAIAIEEKIKVLKLLSGLSSEELARLQAPLAAPLFVDASESFRVMQGEPVTVVDPPESGCIAIVYDPTKDVLNVEAPSAVGLVEVFRLLPAFNTIAIEEKIKVLKLLSGWSSEELARLRAKEFKAPTDPGLVGRQC